jgi:hypothetical protein
MYKKHYTRAMSFRLFPFCKLDHYYNSMMVVFSKFVKKKKKEKEKEKSINGILSTKMFNSPFFFKPLHESFI